MNTDTICLKNITEGVRLTGQQNIDADIILPDYYDSIGKIIRCTATPVTEATTINGDKLSIAGIARYSIIYIGEDKEIYCYENSCKYTKVFQSKYAEEYIASTAKQSVFSLNYRAIGPKRIELRSVIQINVSILNSSEKLLISAIDDHSIVTKSEEISFLSKVNCVTSDISATATFSSKDFKDNVDVIIRRNSKLKLTEIKTIHNKAYIKGTAETEIVYFSKESGNISETVLSIPVSEIIDIFGAEEDDLCNVIINDIFTDVTIRDEHSSEKSLEIRLDINLKTEICRNEAGAIITDLYSTSDNLNTESETVEFIIAASKSTKTESINFETEIYDDNEYIVSRCWLEDIKISPEKKDNRYVLLITASFSTLLKDTNGGFSVISRDHTFESEILCNDSECELNNIRTNILSISANIIKSGKVRISADIQFETDIISLCKVNAFTKVTTDENSQCCKNSNYIIYFAKENEEIWSIAKENRAPVEKLMQINQLSGEFITEDRMLLLPSF